jgi:Na+/proline symporter
VNIKACNSWGSCFHILHIKVPKVFLGRVFELLGHAFAVSYCCCCCCCCCFFFFFFFAYLLFARGERGVVVYGLFCSVLCVLLQRPTFFIFCYWYFCLVDSHRQLSVWEVKQILRVHKIFIFIAVNVKPSSHLFFRLIIFCASSDRWVHRRTR